MNATDSKKGVTRRFTAGVAGVFSLRVLVAVPIGGGATSLAAAATSNGCGATSPGTTTLSLEVNGFSRTVIVHVPKGFTKMDASSSEDDFIVAYPQALIPDGLGFDWNIPGVPLIGGRKVPAKSA